jgi:hypothetical protein
MADAQSPGLNIPDGVCRECSMHPGRLKIYRSGLEGITKPLAGQEYMNIAICKMGALAAFACENGRFDGSPKKLRSKYKKLAPATLSPRFFGYQWMQESLITSMQQAFHIQRDGTIF